MNCKKGDLAFIVRSAAKNEGKLVRIIRWVGHYRYLEGNTTEQAWLCECLSEVRGASGKITKVGGTRNIPDANLRPIRDPGEDAVDESHAYLPPVPTHHKEPA